MLVKGDKLLRKGKKMRGNMPYKINYLCILREVNS